MLTAGWTRHAWADHQVPWSPHWSLVSLASVSDHCYSHCAGHHWVHLLRVDTDQGNLRVGILDHWEDSWDHCSWQEEHQGRVVGVLRIQVVHQEVLPSLLLEEVVLMVVDLPCHLEERWVHSIPSYYDTVPEDPVVGSQGILLVWDHRDLVHRVRDLHILVSVGILGIHDHREADRVDHDQVCCTCEVGDPC